MGIGKREKGITMLKETVLKMADRREAPDNYLVNEDRYELTLHDMAYESEFSYPAYLLLTYCWNDILDWAEDPKKYVNPTDDSKVDAKK